jgi:hypothetical protein
MSLVLAYEIEHCRNLTETCLARTVVFPVSQHDVGLGVPSAMAGVGDVNSHGLTGWAQAGTPSLPKPHSDPDRSPPENAASARTETHIDLSFKYSQGPRGYGPDVADVARRGLPN